MDEKSEDNLVSLTVGDRVFYPSHGVASVTGTEEREFGGEPLSLYVLKLVRGGTLLVPVGKVERAGIRSLVPVKVASKLLQMVKEDPEGEVAFDVGSRKSRNARYADLLRTGSADAYTEVLRELLYRTRRGKLVASEQRTLDAARGYFVGEICAALDVSPDEIEEQLSSVTGM